MRSHIQRRVNTYTVGRVVSASDSETSVSSSTPTSAIIYDAYNSILKKKNKKYVHRLQFWCQARNATPIRIGD